MTAPATAPEPDTSRGVALGDFSLFGGCAADAYLEFCAMAPPSDLVRSAIAAWVDDYATWGAKAWSAWAEQRERTRGKLARLLSCNPGDIGLGPGTSSLISDITLMIDWRPGDRVLSFNGEFPALIEPLQNTARMFDLELVMQKLDGFGDGSGNGLARVEAELKQGLRLVAVSATQFQTGLCMPIRELAALCHRYSAEILVDAAQALGVVPVDVKADGIDFLAGAAHKFLMGVEGCGVLYIAPSAMKRLVLRRSGWLSQEGGLAFLWQGPGLLRYDHPVPKRPSVVELGTSSAIGFAALEAGLSPILKLGVPAIYGHVQALHDRLEPALAALGFQSVRAEDPACRSGILSFLPPNGTDVVELGPKLTERGVYASIPDGYIRFGPGWPTPESQIDRAIYALRDIVGNT